MSRANNVPVPVRCIKLVHRSTKRTGDAHASTESRSCVGPYPAEVARNEASTHEVSFSGLSNTTPDSSSPITHVVHASSCLQKVVYLFGVVLQLSRSQITRLPWRHLGGSVHPGRWDTNLAELTAREITQGEFQWTLKHHT